MNQDEYREWGICCICHGNYERWGNNAEPIMDGMCCDSCNQIVIRARLNDSYRTEEAEKTIRIK